MQMSSQSNRLDQSQNSRDSSSIINKIKAIPQKLTSLVGNLIFGSQASQEPIRKSGNRGYYKQSQSQPDDDDDLVFKDEFDKISANLPDQRIELNIDNYAQNDMRLRQEKLISNRNFSFAQTPELTSLVQSKSEHLLRGVQPQRLNRIDNDFLQENSSINFSNPYFNRDAKLESNKKYESMWTRYNERMFKLNEVNLQSRPRKASLINAVKVFAERSQKQLLTADNQRQLLQIMQRYNIVIKKPIVKKAQPFVEETKLARRKRDPTFQQSQNQLSQRLKKEDNEDQVMLTQKTHRKSIEKQNQSKKVKEGVIKAMSVQDLQRMKYDAKKIESEQDFQTLANKIADCVSQRVIDNEIKRNRKYLVAPQVSGEAFPAKIVNDMLTKMEQQLREERHENERLRREKEEEIKKLLNKDALISAIKEIIQDQISSQMSQYENSQIRSQMSQEAPQQQYNLLIQEMSEIKSLLKENTDQMMQSQNSFRQQKSVESNSSNSNLSFLQDMSSQSPIPLLKKENSPALIKASTEVKSSKPKVLEKIEEEKKEEKKVDFLVNKDQEKKENILIIQSADKDKSPSFGDRSDNKSAASFNNVSRQESFVSEALSTPEAKKDNSTNATAPSFQIKFNANPVSNPVNNENQNQAPVVQVGSSTNVVTNPFLKQNEKTAATTVNNPFLSSSNANTTATKPNPFVLNTSTTPTGTTPAPAFPAATAPTSQNPFASTLNATNTTQSNPFQFKFNSSTPTPTSNTAPASNPFAANNSASQKPAFAFNNQANPAAAPSNPFAQNTQQPQTSFTMNSSFNSNANGAPKFGNGNGSNPFASNTNAFQSSNNSFTNNSSTNNNQSRPMAPFNNATNFQQPQNNNNNIQRSSFNTGNNPFASGSGSGSNFSSNNPFSGGSNQPNNPFSNTNNNNSNQFSGSTTMGGQSNNFANQNQGSFNIGQKKTNTSSTDNDDLFATGGRKIYKAKRNL